MPRIVLMTFLALILLLVIIEAIRLAYLYASISRYKNYWEAQIAKPIEAGDFVYVAVGDSVAQGIGASSPQKSYVGMTAAYIQQKTGRNVHVINVSVTGAKVADVVRDQLPRIKNLKPDLVTLDIGANDVNKNVPVADFQRDFTTILDALPAGKTIVADLPTFERGPKQSVLFNLNKTIHEDIEAHGLELAPIFEYTSKTIHDWSTYAADFFHPSDKGYRNWYAAFETKLKTMVK